MANPVSGIWWRTPKDIARSNDSAGMELTPTVSCKTMIFGLPVNLVFNTGPSEEEHILTEFKLIDIQREGNLENSFIITLGSLKSNLTKELYVNKSGRNIDFLLSDKFECLPEKRKDSKLILKLLTEQGVDVSDVDLRSITYEDSGF